MRRTLVILGAGYLARFIRLISDDCYSNVRFTSRSPAINLSDVSIDRRILFDLSQPETWGNIPGDADLLWSFPAAPLDAVQRFAARINGSFRRLVVLGSTSAYERGASPAIYPALQRNKADSGEIFDMNQIDILSGRVDPTMLDPVERMSVGPINACHAKHDCRTVLPKEFFPLHPWYAVVHCSGFVDPRRGIDSRRCAPLIC